MNPDKPFCGTADHWSRRTFLKAAGAGSLGWLTPLAHSLALEEKKGRSRAKSVIVLWMAGGISQLESFDPHPGKAIAYGANAIKTAVPGISIGDGLPQTAELMNDIALVRSMTSLEGDHARANYNIRTGHRPMPGLSHPSIGAVVCHELPDQGIALPRHVSIMPEFASRGGYLGAQYDPFKINDPVESVPDVTSRVDDVREAERLKSLSVVEQAFANRAQRDESMIAAARRMMTSDQLKAFEVKDAPKATLEAFGENKFGRGCLAAVQLIEAGVRCVEVTLNGFDSHINNAELQAGRIAELDPAFAELIRQLKARDLFDSTVLVCASEFGRTPQHNLAEGRDHWPHGFSVALAGGGIVGGRVIGETDPTGESKEPSDPVKVEDLHATIQTALGIDPEYEAMAGNRPIPLSEGRIVKGLLDV